MKRLAIALVTIVAVSSVTDGGDIAGARDDAEATISALRTEVVHLKSTAEARGEKINRQRTRIAELREGTATATPADKTFDLEGVNDVKIYDRFVAGVHTVEAECEGETMQVYVLDPTHGIVAQPVSRSALGEVGDLRVSFPADGEYKVEIYCAGRWRVTFTLGST